MHYTWWKDQIFGDNCMLPSTPIPAHSVRITLEYEHITTKGKVKCRSALHWPWIQGAILEVNLVKTLATLFMIGWIVNIMGRWKIESPATCKVEMRPNHLHAIGLIL